MKQRLLLSLILLTCSACSGLGGISIPVIQTGESIQGEGIASGKKPPVSIKVISADIVSGNRLRVTTDISSAIRLSSEEISIALIGLVDGQEQFRSSTVLSEATSAAILYPNEPAVITLDIPANGIDTYQVACSWGEEGKSKQAKVKELERVEPKVVRAQEFEEEDFFALQQEKVSKNQAEKIISAKSNLKATESSMRKGARKGTFLKKVSK